MCIKLFIVFYYLFNVCKISTGIFFYSFLFFKIKKIFLKLSFYFSLINLFLAALGLCCYTRAFSSCGERGLLFVAAHGLLIAVASLVAELRL